MLHVRDMFRKKKKPVIIDDDLRKSLEEEKRKSIDERRKSSEEKDKRKSKEKGDSKRGSVSSPSVKRNSKAEPGTPPPKPATTVAPSSPSVVVPQIQTQQAPQIQQTPQSPQSPDVAQNAPQNAPQNVPQNVVPNAPVANPMLPAESVASGDVRTRYVFGQLLGKGAFSEVFEVVERATKERFAVKAIKKKFIKKKLVEREIGIMTKLRHENILHCREVYETDDFIYLVLELVRGGELYDKIVDDGEFSEEEAKEIVIQMLNAVEYLHENGIAHRDLKPENILCMDRKPRKPGQMRHERIKVADFGLSKAFVAEDLTSQCGSPTYVAPEVLMSKKPYDKAVDMWAIGVITFVSLTGCFPFYEEGKNYGALYQKIMNVDYYFPEEPKLSSEAKNFIQKLLVRDPERRFTPAQCRAHPWLKGVKLPNEK